MASDLHSGKFTGMSFFKSVRFPTWKQPSRCRRSGPMASGEATKPDIGPYQVGTYEIPDAWRGHEQAEAKKRQGTRNDLVETFPPSEPAKSRDKIGERVGVSGKSIDKVAVVKAYAPEKLEDSSTLEQAYREANARRNC